MCFSINVMFEWHAHGWSIRDPRSSSWEQRADANNQLHEISTTVPLKPFTSTHHTSICNKLHHNKVSRIFIKRWKIKNFFFTKAWNLELCRDVSRGRILPNNSCANKMDVLTVECTEKATHQFSELNEFVSSLCPLTVTLISFLPLSYHILQSDWPPSQACGPKLSQRRINTLKMNSKQHQTPPFPPVAQPEQSCQPKLLHVDFIRDPSSSSRHALNPPLSWFSPHKICCCFSQLQTETSLMTSFQCDSPGSTHPDRQRREAVTKPVSVAVCSAIERWVCSQFYVVCRATAE